eukprot:1183794-Pyramimonas_sp.AAC.1
MRPFLLDLLDLLDLLRWVRPFLDEALPAPLLVCSACSSARPAEVDEATRPLFRSSARPALLLDLFLDEATPTLHFSSTCGGRATVSAGARG